MAFTFASLLPSEPTQGDDGASTWSQQRPRETEEAQPPPSLLLPLEYMPDVGRFLPDLATELATAQTTQDEEVEQKEQRLRQLQVYMLEGSMKDSRHAQVLNL